MATEAQAGRRRSTVGVLAVCAAAGLLFVAAATTSDGADLRPGGDDLRSVVADRAAQVESQRARADRLDAEVDSLAGAVPGGDDLAELRERATSLAGRAGLQEADGPGVRVALSDAPRDVEPDDVDPNVLVVHEQDIRAFVNALWAGGAEAVTLQGQRIVSTSSITCVGSTVVIDGVPYAPPYVIEAVGDVSGMTFSLATSPQVSNYKRYAARYGLGLDITSHDALVLPPHDGSVLLTYATALRRDPATTDDD